MRDLRKKILLESGKTVSRKARSKPDSNFGSGTLTPSSSPAGSRPGSRAPSRYASEDDMSDSDTDNLSSSLVTSDDGEGAIRDWTDQLKDCINEILDRKRSSVQGREKYMNGFVHLARHHFADYIIDNQLSGLVPALLRCIQSGRNAAEAVAAMKALQVTAISTQSDNIYDQVFSTLRAQCENSDEESVKIEAINTMGAVTIFGGGLEESVQELMSFLLEIVESDGHSIEAGDNGPVVTAALTTWGFLASHLDDLVHESEEALEAFAEQLESIDADVQIASGSNIALIFEAVTNYNTQAEEEHNRRQQELMEEARRRKERHILEPFNPFDLQYNQHKLIQRITELASEASRSVSRKTRRNLHANFNSILTSLTRGTGPNYSTAGRLARPSDREGERVRNSERGFQEYGYRDRVKGNNDMQMTVDSWSLSMRVHFMKRALGGGFSTHWEFNPAVQESFDSA